MHENHVKRGARLASPRARKVLGASRAHVLVHSTIPGKKRKTTCSRTITSHFCRFTAGQWVSGTVYPTLFPITLSLWPPSINMSFILFYWNFIKKNFLIGWAWQKKLQSR